MKNALIIPGLGGTPDCWSNLFMERLRSVYRVESIALPETGDTISDFAGIISPEEPPDLIAGFSIGAAVLQEMLVAHPQWNTKVVLMAPPAGNRFPGPPDEAHDFSDGRGRWSAAMLELMFTSEWLAEHPDVTEFFPRVKKPVSGERLVIQSNAIKGWEGCIDKLGRVHEPVLIIAGLHDIITPVIHARAIHSALPCSTISIMETGHGFPWQCPVETADTILEFAT